METRVRTNKREKTVTIETNRNEILIEEYSRSKKIVITIYDHLKNQSKVLILND